MVRAFFVSRRLRAVAAGALAVGLLALALAGCAAHKTLVPNLPPETTVFVQGDVDTVNHIVHLYWFGSDPDGSVVDYEVRFLNPSDPGDTAWVSTTTVSSSGAPQVRTDSLFTVYTPDGFTEPVFEVRAVDNAGERDPTPARQTFKFSNRAPTVRLINVPALNDTTFASVTLTWAPQDPDGNVSEMTYRVWLDGNQANPVIAKGITTFTVPTDQFFQGGQLLSGYRTAYVQAIDDGGRASTVDSTKWYVRAPVTGTRARLLIVDDVPTSNSVNTQVDTLFSNPAGRLGLPSNEYTILRLQNSQPFRSSKDVEQTLKLFEAVIWYRGNETQSSGSPQPNYWQLLRDYEDGIGAYLDSGGKICIEGLELITELNARGALSGDFAMKYLDTDGFFRNFNASVGDSTGGWGNTNGNLFVSSFNDTLNTLGVSTAGIRAFRVRSTSDIFVTAPVGQLGGANPIPMPIAVSVPQATGGHAIVITFPLAYANRSPYRNAPAIAMEVYEMLGLAGP